MWRRNKPVSETPRCSFCRKNQNEVGKLISSPIDDVPAFICDECVSVCESILEDDRDVKEADTSTLEQNEPHPFFDDQLVSDLVEAVERWIAKEHSGVDAVPEFAAMRNVAIRFIDGKQP
jgi:hypothetical protein